jgi:hypothetical protein
MRNRIVESMNHIDGLDLGLQLLLSLFARHAHGERDSVELRMYGCRGSQIWGASK